jgi:hypothetical protein
MALTFAPLNWNNIDLSKPDQARRFLFELTTYLNQIQNSIINPGGLAAALNGNAFLQASALSVKTTSLGVVTTNQTVDCTGAIMVSIRFSVSTNFSPTLALTNLSEGAQVTVRFSNAFVGGAVTLTMTATDPAAAAYTINWKTSTALTNMGTGLSVAASTVMIASGNSDGGLVLAMVAN